MKAFTIAIACSCFLSAANAQLARFTLPMEQFPVGMRVPVCRTLDAGLTQASAQLALVEVKDGQRIAVPFQVANDSIRRLYWMVERDPKGPSQRVFELIKGTKGVAPATVTVTDDQRSLTIHANNKSLLKYVYATHYPPAGVDTAFKRSGFIHPLYTPHGQVLTRINPKDHYHHYGLWNPFTRIFFEGDTLDFWNLKDRKGTVQFANLNGITEGAVFGGYEVHQQHIAFKKDGTQKLCLNEQQSVRIYKPATNSDYYIADISITLRCAGDSPVVFPQYRYGGFAWRATEEWTPENSTMLTSEGKIRRETDATRARWLLVQGSLGQDKGGMVIFSSPNNFNHPEQIRTWAGDNNGEKGVFLNFSPIKDRSWTLLPGQDYTQQYRLLVFNGTLSAATAEAAWQQYANAMH